MDGRRLSHFEGPVEKKKAVLIDWNNKYLGGTKGGILFNPESWVQPTKNGGSGWPGPPVFDATSFAFFLSEKPL
jgi:hypothetical protein